MEQGGAQISIGFVVKIVLKGYYPYPALIFMLSSFFIYLLYFLKITLLTSKNSMMINTQKSMVNTVLRE
jgi:hypothetical protein